MSTVRRVPKRMVKTGTVVFEAFEPFPCLAGANEKEEEAFVRQFLKQQGFKVNGLVRVDAIAKLGLDLTKTDRSRRAKPRRRRECRTWHEVYPRESYFFYGCY